MEKIKSIFNLKNIYSLVLLLIFFVVMKASLLTPMVNEDFDLNATGKSFGDVFLACKGQYLHWNARIGDILSLALSVIPINLFNFLNAVVVVFFILVISYIATLFKEEKVTYLNKINALLFIFFAFIFYIQRPGEVFFWRTGAANYLYPALFIFLYVIPFLFFLLKGKNVFALIENHFLRYAFIATYIILGLIVGHANENTSVVVVFFSLLVMLHGFIVRKKFELWMILSTITIAIGTALLLFGPSTLYRLQFYAQIFGKPASPVNLLIMNYKIVLLSFLGYVRSLLVFIVVAFLLVEEKKSFVLVVGSCLSFSLMSVLILAAAPYQEPRAFFVSSVLVIIPIIYGIYLLPKLLSKVCLLILCVVLISNISYLENEYGNMKLRYYSQNQRIDQIKKQLEKNGDIEISKMPIASTQLVLIGGTDDEAARMARFFKLIDRKIIITK
jgi:hypothetical protein